MLTSHCRDFVPRWTILCVAQNGPEFGQQSTSGGKSTISTEGHMIKPELHTKASQRIFINAGHAKAAQCLYNVVWRVQCNSICLRVCHETR